MAIEPEDLARNFAPKLYFRGAVDPYNNIRPEEMGGLYWQSVKSSVPETDVCIQYIAYFKEQHWTPKIMEKFSFLDKFFGKLPGIHPNDYVPIFLYFENGKPKKAIFDICHYEAVGKIEAPSRLLPQDEGPKFHIRGFYRGLLPLGDDRSYKHLEGDPIPLSQERLNNWWDGIASDGNRYEKAELIIKDKFRNPFQGITTFCDCSGKLGALFDWVFRLKMETLNEVYIFLNSSNQSPSASDYRDNGGYIEVLDDLRIQEFDKGGSTGGWNGMTILGSNTTTAELDLKKAMLKLFPPEDTKNAIDLLPIELRTVAKEFSPEEIEQVKKFIDVYVFNRKVRRYIDLRKYHFGSQYLPIIENR